MPERRNWTRDELLLVFHLYCRTPFGRLNSSNPDFVELATHIHRTPSAVSMKACNFASLDPVQQARGKAGLGHASKADRGLWEEFFQNSEAIAVEMEAVHEGMFGSGGEPPIPELPDLGETEKLILVRARRVQRFFRDAVMTAYASRCAITGLAVPGLLEASHIVPWSVDPARRADPRNGIVLNSLHHRAFDRGLIGLDESLQVMLSPSLESGPTPEFHRAAFAEYEGHPIMQPIRYKLDLEAVQYHREHVFVA